MTSFLKHAEAKTPFLTCLHTAYFGRMPLSIHATLKQFVSLRLYTTTAASIFIAPLFSPQVSHALDWKQIEAGFSFAKYELGSPSAVLRPEAYLLKFDPKYFAFQCAVANNSGAGKPAAADIRTLAKENGAIAGINANFFDESGNPLGLIIYNSEIRHKIQKGGRVLTGIFAVRSTGQIVIEHRDNFKPEQTLMAVQAGPRLVENGKPIEIGSSEETSRRSGVAITKDNEVILYATVLRFPGATLGDIQEMLLDPALGVIHALNLDGGGSSQLFIESSASLSGETFLSGGDPVPVGLVVKRKNSKP